VIRSFILALVCCTAAAYAADDRNAQVPEIPFDSVPNFLKLPPNLYLGEASGVAVNSKHHVFVFSRGNTTGPAYGATAAQILEFGPDGKYIREIGHNLYAWSFAHAIRFDKDDDLWAVDKGSDMVIEFDPEGRVKMVFGRKKEASDEGDEPWKRLAPGQPPRPAINGQFRQPTDVTWDPNGDIFISDGYVNSRVAKFDKNGDWVKQWGTFGSDPGQFNTPLPMPNGTFTWRTAGTGASRFSIPTACCCARSRSTFRCRPWCTCGWAIRRRPLRQPRRSARPRRMERCRTDRPGRFASRQVRGRSICTARMRIRDGFTSSRSMARCWACSGAWATS